MSEHDPYLWLEEVDGERALAWARERNAGTLAALESVPGFADRVAALREVLDSDDQLPLPALREGLLYTFWQDEAHPRGLWRRTTPEEYRRERPEWEILLDVDALAENEGENWVWQGAEVLRPGCRRALVSLSRGGGDAAVIREYDLEKRAFVTGGYALAEAKSDVAWRDPDTVFVGTDTGPGSLTRSGYPRTVRLWRRGTDLADAPVIFEGEPEDVGVGAWRDRSPAHVRDLVRRSTDFFHGHTYVLGEDGGLTRIEVPDDATVEPHGPWLLIRPRDAWTVGGREYPGGSLLAAAFDDLLDPTLSPRITALFTPDGRSSLADVSLTREHVVVTVMTDVRTHLRVFAADAAGWRELDKNAATDDDVAVVATDPQVSDQYLTRTTGFVTPATLWSAVAGDQAVAERLRGEPAFFDATGMGVAQHFATSVEITRAD